MRDRTLYIVEIPNGNWHTITRIKKEAENALEHWIKYIGDAKLITVQVPDD